MKEIKFRYYEKDDANRLRRMVYGKPDDTNMEYFFGDAERNENLMLYTGLKDKNGEEIYEGDIVKRYHISNQEPRIGEVVYIEKNAKFGFKTNFLGSEITHQLIEEPLVCWVEKLGNKYENPELLEEAND